jgi:hypothetical protein
VEIQLSEGTYNVRVSLLDNGGVSDKKDMWKLRFFSGQ